MVGIPTPIETAVTPVRYSKDGVLWQDPNGMWKKMARQTDGSMVVAMQQDVEPIMEEMKKRQNSNVHEFQPNKLGKFLGRIPNTVIYQALKKYGIEARVWMKMPGSEQAKFYKRILADPDYKHFRAS